MCHQQLRLTFCQQFDQTTTNILLNRQNHTDITNKCKQSINKSETARKSTMNDIFVFLQSIYLAVCWPILFAYTQCDHLHDCRLFVRLAFQTLFIHNWFSCVNRKMTIIAYDYCHPNGCASSFKEPYSSTIALLLTWHQSMLLIVITFHLFYTSIFFNSLRLLLCSLFLSFTSLSFSSSMYFRVILFRLFVYVLARFVRSL